jgi:outer membrane receptor protein involved in Fe transport
MILFINTKYIYLLIFLVCFLSAIELLAQNQEMPPTKTETQEELGAITVQAERPDWERILSPGTVSVVYPDDLRGEHKDLGDMLIRIPGVHLSKRGSDGQYTTVSVRGSTAAQVNVYIDGVPQNSGISGVVDLSLIPMNNVERIEVYRGYTPVRFVGAPIGGVINIVTKRPLGFGGRAAAGASSFGGMEGEALVNFPILKGTALISAHYDKADNNFSYERLLTLQPNLPTRRTRLGNGYEAEDAMLKWQGDNLYFKTTVRRMERDYPQSTDRRMQGTQWVDYAPCFGLPEGGLIPGICQGVMYPGQHRHQKQDQLDLTIGRRQTLGNLDFGLEVNYSHQKSEYEYKNLRNYYTGNSLAGFPPFAIWSIYDTKKSSLTADASYRLGALNLLEFRGTLEKEKTSMDGNNLDDDTYPGNKAFIKEYEQKRIYIQLQDTFTLSDSMWLTGIFRYDSIRDNVNRLKSTYGYAFNPNANQLYPNEEDSAMTFGLALKKDIGEHWTFSTSYGTFHRFPTFFELFGDGVNVLPAFMAIGGVRSALVKAETGDQWDVGLEWHGQLMESKSKLKATYFNRFTQDHIEFRVNTLTGKVYPINSDNLNAEGVEMEALLNWHKFDLFASATWFSPRKVSEATWKNIPEASVVPMQAEWEFFVRADYRLLDNRLSLFAEHHYFGESDWFLSAGLESPIRETNVGIKLKIPYNFMITAGIDDLFNKGPRRYCVGCAANQYFIEKVNLAYPEPGRTWYANLEYQFGGGANSGTDGMVSKNYRVMGNGLTIDLAAKPMPIASAAGSIIKNKTPFYIAPKIIMSKQSHTVGPAGNVTITDQADNTYANSLNTPYDKTGIGSYPYQIPGGKGGKNAFMGALALGVDLYELSNWPFRIELEFGTKIRQGKLGTIGAVATIDNRESPGSNPLCTWTDQYGDLCQWRYWSLPDEFGYRNHTAFLNFFADWHNDSKFTPYIGAGLGFSYTKIKYKRNAYFKITNAVDIPSAATIDLGSVDEDGKRNVSRQVNFAWNASVGISYDMTEDVALDLSYRYMNSDFNAIDDGRKNFNISRFSGYTDVFVMSGSVDKSSFDINSDVHQVIMGLRFKF